MDIPDMDGNENETSILPTYEESVSDTESTKSIVLYPDEPTDSESDSESETEARPVKKRPNKVLTKRKKQASYTKQQIAKHGRNTFSKFVENITLEPATGILLGLFGLQFIRGLSYF
jgi:uncharacterized protein YrzB (UPF0473 family)